jgi:hypothetical protein
MITPGGDGPPVRRPFILNTGGDSPAPCHHHGPINVVITRLLTGPHFARVRCLETLGVPSSVPSAGAPLHRTDRSATLAVHAQKKPPGGQDRGASQSSVRTGGTGPPIAVRPEFTRWQDATMSSISDPDPPGQGGSPSTSPPVIYPTATEPIICDSARDVARFGRAHRRARPAPRRTFPEQRRRSRPFGASAARWGRERLL